MAIANRPRRKGTKNEVLHQKVTNQCHITLKRALFTGQKRSNVLTDEDDIKPALIRRRVPRPQRHGQRHNHRHEPDRREQQPSLLAKVPDGRDLPAVRTPGQGIVQRVEEEVVVAVRAVDAAHARHVGHGGRGHRLARGEADDALAVGAGARNALENKKIQIDISYTFV